MPFGFTNGFRFLPCNGQGLSLGSRPAGNTAISTCCQVAVRRRTASRAATSVKAVTSRRQVPRLPRRAHPYQRAGGVAGVVLLVLALLMVVLVPSEAIFTEVDDLVVAVATSTTGQAVDKAL